MELEKVSNIEFSLSKRTKEEVFGMLSMLLVFAGGAGFLEQIQRHNYNPVLTTASVAAFISGSMISFSPIEENFEAPQDGEIFDNF